MKKLSILLFIVSITLSGYAQNYIESLTDISSISKSDYQQDLCISPDNKYMAIATPSAIKIVDVLNFKIIKLIPVEFKSIKLISFLSTADKVLIVGDGKNGASAEIYSWSEKKLIKQTNPLGEGDATMFFMVAKSDNYLICANNKKHILYVLNPNTLELIKKIPVAGKALWGLTISHDESLIAFYKSALLGDQELYVYDFNGVQKYSHPFAVLSLTIAFTSTNELVVLAYSMKGGTTETVYKIKSDFSSMVTLFNTTGLIGSSMICDADKYIIYQDDFLDLICIEDKSLNKISSGFIYGLGFKGLNVVPRSVELSNDMYLVPRSYENLNAIIDAKNKKLLGYIYHKGNSLAFVAPDGRFTGDDKAISNLKYRISGMSDINLASQINQLYTPRLFNQILNTSYTSEINVADLSRIVKLSPELRFISPDSISNQGSNSIKVKYTAKEHGDGIKEVRFYINGKLLSDDARGFKAVGEGSREIPIIVGENIIEAVAISNSGYQSSPDRVMVTYKGAETTTNLYILGVGIDQYKNPKYNLNYALADASSIVDYIKTNGVGIFKSIDVKLLTDGQATKANIVTELSRIAKQANETDVFMLYYAGHGVMSDGSPEVPKDYFMALTDVYQLYGNDNLLAEKGLSAAELREWCQQVKAQKQVILLDACQSGGATETFAMRGASEEKAIIQLAQSTGVFLISSTGAEQFATEFTELKHGVFTYAFLEGLKGAADGGRKDGKITIKELEAYLNDRIPELSQKYRGSIQFPNTWSRGMDFPIVIAK